MTKKTKSKQRLDAYYHFAKQQGYRSRAAYKLIQLNRKYNFLSNATTLIDLCAAPGGWMQVASECMPLNSLIIGVDLDPIKRVPGTKSFQGDITTPACYEQLRKELKGGKCDAVLNDGAPNVGANWSKDAYTQSELVLYALKLACSFLRQGGYFVTKVFRSTDYQSLMWVFKKFFEKVEATKPKASRFVSAEIFVVCAGFLAPSFIDEKLFDAKYIFQDTEADHFRDQLAGDITSIDKIVEERRKRGGYEDNAPMHLYKETTLTNLMTVENPLLLFAEYNKITTTKQERDKYYNVIKGRPSDLDQMFDDLRVLGKREIASILRWRGKVHHHFNVNQVKKERSQKKELKPEQEIDSEVQLEREVLQSKRRQIKQLKQKEQKRGQLMIKSQRADLQNQEDDAELEGQMGDDVFGGDIEDLQYDPEPEKQQQKESKRKVAIYSAKQMEKNLQEIYENRKRVRDQKEQKIRDAKQQRKDRRDERFHHKQQKLKSRKIGADPALVPTMKQHEEDEEEEGQEIFPQEDNEVRFRNPLADIDDDDLYLSENEQQYKKVQIDPDQKIQGQVSDDDAYVIPKPMSDMERRRQNLKKTREKKEKKLKQDIEQGQEVGGKIEIVKRKQMDDYNVDELAETLAIAKKMLRNRSREEIIDNSYSRFTFEDHSELPKWFTQDQQKHNFKQVPISKEQFQQEKERIMAINARVPKKIMEAKVRKKMRVQKKLKKTQKQAESVMSQDGVTQFNKLKQVSKLYDKSKRELKDKKKYMVSKKGKTGFGKDSRNIKHVDRRLKKDKKSQKIKKTRHVDRKHKRRGKF